jgi:hypothetical protein
MCCKNVVSRIEFRFTYIYIQYRLAGFDPGSLNTQGEDALRGEYFRRLEASKYRTKRPSGLYSSEERYVIIIYLGV